MLSVEAVVKKKELVCFECGDKLLRDISVVNRNQKLGRKIYCSRECANKNHSIEHQNKTDEFSPFRNIFKKAKQRSSKKKIDFLISLENLKDIWDKQNGKCPYTGWDMTLSSKTTDKSILTPFKASVDRIDSSKGYIPGNIQFVSYMANIAKNNFHENELIDFCKAVFQNNLKG
jgi:hypothetical protein